MKSDSRDVRQENVILYDEKVLKVLAKVIAEYFIVPEIAEILILKDIPKSRINNSENGFEILIKVFLDIKENRIKLKIENKMEKISLSGERHISRIIEEFLHPLSHSGDTKRIQEFSDKIQNIVTHDNLSCYRWGKSFRIFEKGEYEITEELRQEELQEENYDLLYENDKAAQQMAFKERLTKTEKNALDIEQSNKCWEIDGDFLYLINPTSKEHIPVGDVKQLIGVRILEDLAKIYPKHRKLQDLYLGLAKRGKSKNHKDQKKWVSNSLGKVYTKNVDLKKKIKIIPLTGESSVLLHFKDPQSRN